MLKTLIKNVQMQTLKAVGALSPKDIKVMEIGKLRENEEKIRDDFLKLGFYGTESVRGFGHSAKWLGIKTIKPPADAWLIQELIIESDADYFIETGTAFGGSAFYVASIFELLGKGEVITIDLPNHESPLYPGKAMKLQEVPESLSRIKDRITYLEGSSTSEAIFEEVKEKVKGKKVLVCLDSDHREKHVYNELQLYSQFVQKDGYLIVEDTIKWTPR